MAVNHKLYMRRAARIGVITCLDKNDFLPKAVHTVYTRNFKAGFCLGKPEAIMLTADKLAISTLILFDVKRIEDKCARIAEDPTRKHSTYAS